MADYDALRDAADVLELATRLLTGTSEEIAALEAAQRAGQESLARVRSTSAACSAFIDSSRTELQRGRQLQDDASRVLVEEAAQDHARWTHNVAPALLHDSAIVTSVVQRLAAPRPTPPEPRPDAAIPNRHALWQGELDVSRRTAWWDVLAEPVKTFGDLKDEALARLAGAERELEKVETRRRQERMDGLGREEQEHEQ